MENQHRQISGYRELSTEEIKQMNAVKALAGAAGEMIELLRVRPDLYDQRWCQSRSRPHSKED